MILAPGDILKNNIWPILHWMGKSDWRLASHGAARMLVAIARQESNWMYRHQIHGPAHGLPMFEVSGCEEALRIDQRFGFFDAYGLPGDAHALHRAIEWSEVGQVIGARLLLWSIPSDLPKAHEPGIAWDQYCDAWNPGAARPNDPRYSKTKARWRAAWRTAVKLVP